MSSCLETDTLVALAELGDDPVPMLLHAVECDRCRDALVAVCRIRREALTRVEARAGFTDEVMSAIPFPSEAKAAGEASGWVWWPVHAALAGAGAFFVAASAGAASPGAAGPSVFVAAAAAAAAVLIAPQLRSP